MSKKINWGIIGCAGIAEQVLIPVIKESSNGVLHGTAAGRGGRARYCLTAVQVPLCPAPVKVPELYPRLKTVMDKT